MAPKNWFRVDLNGKFSWYTARLNPISLCTLRIEWTTCTCCVGQIKPHIANEIYRRLRASFSMMASSRSGTRFPLKLLAPTAGDCDDDMWWANINRSTVCHWGKSLTNSYQQSGNLIQVSNGVVASCRFAALPWFGKYILGNIIYTDEGYR